MATREDGRWAARTTGREMPRQNGKGDEIEVVELWGLVQRGERIGHTIHDAVLLATQTQDRMLRILGHKDLRSRVLRTWRGTGQQMIEMRNGGIIWYRTRTKGGLVGVDDVDRVVVDEAQFATRSHIEAITPTMLANDNPQLNVQGTAGIDHTPEASAWWWSIRLRALSGDHGDFGYIGHTAEAPALVEGRLVRTEFDPASPEVWMACNPALAAGRGQGMEFFAEQFRVLGAASFASQHLCVWNEPPTGEAGAGVIDMALWERCAKDESTAASHRTWALAVSPDQSWASLAVAGRREDGLLHVDVVDRRKGTAWIVERVVEGWREFGLPLRVAARDRNTLVSTLRERGVEVVELTVPEVAQGVGLVRSLVESGELAHLGRTWLRAAAKVAQLTSSGVWAAPRDGEVTALEAVTLAASGVPRVAEPMFAY